MKTKLMISVLLFCSSLSFAADSATPAPTEAKKKMAKPSAPPSADKAQQVDEAVLGNGIGGLGTGGMGTGSSSAPMKMVRGKGTAVRK